MIPAVPVDTVEKPITVIDYVAKFAECSSLGELEQYSGRCPETIRDTLTFRNAMARRAVELVSKKAA